MVQDALRLLLPLQRINVAGMGGASKDAHSLADLGVEHLVQVVDGEAHLVEVLAFVPHPDYYGDINLKGHLFYRITCTKMLSEVGHDLTGMSKQMFCCVTMN